MFKLAITVTDADSYLLNNVLRNDEWVAADVATKQRALNNAQNQLYRIYKNFRLTDVTLKSGYILTANPMTDIPIFEQALWLLRVDDAIIKAQYGVKMVSVAGVQIQVDNVHRYVCPEAIAILGRVRGSYYNERVGSEVDDYNIHLLNKIRRRV